MPEAPTPARASDPPAGRAAAPAARASWGVGVLALLVVVRLTLYPLVTGVLERQAHLAALQARLAQAEAAARAGPPQGRDLNRRRALEEAWARWAGGVYHEPSRAALEAAFLADLRRLVRESGLAREKVQLLPPAPQPGATGWLVLTAELTLQGREEALLEFWRILASAPRLYRVASFRVNRAGDTLTAGVTLHALAHPPGEVREAGEPPPSLPPVPPPPGSAPLPPATARLFQLPPAAGGSSPALPPLRVEGVVLGPGTPVALLRHDPTGQVRAVTVGEQTWGWTIGAIREGAVVVRWGEAEVRLLLPP